MYVYIRARLSLSLSLSFSHLIGRWFTAGLHMEYHLEGIPLQIGLVLHSPSAARQGQWMVMRMMEMRMRMQHAWMRHLMLHQTQGHVLCVLSQSRWAIELQMRHLLLLLWMLWMLWMLRRLLLVLLLADNLLDVLAGLLPLVHLAQQRVPHEGHALKVLPVGAELLLRVLRVSLLLQLVHVALFDDRPAGLHESCKHRQDVWMSSGC